MAEAGIEQVGIIIAPETGDEIRGGAAGDGSRFARRDHLHRAGRAARPGPRRADHKRRCRSARARSSMYLGDNLLQGRMAKLVNKFLEQFGPRR